MPQTGPTRVLIVDDSPTQRFVLARLIEAAGDMVVVGQAGDGQEAVVLTEKLRPNVISMDMKMPGVDGLNATRQIMNLFPTPIVVVSTTGKSQAAMELLQAGALAAVEKPPAPSDPSYAARCDEIIKMLRLMAEVRVIRHWNPDGLGTRPLAAVPPLQAARVAAPLGSRATTAPAIVGIGASAGGPGALAKVLSSLPSHFPLPILVVQHLSEEFVPGLAAWLNRSCAVHVRLAAEHESPTVGTVHIAPGNRHLRVSADKQLVLDSEAGAYRHMPAVDALFASLAEGYGARAIGVVLTGMGDDGAQGLLSLRESGARTIAQDEATCVVFGMPGAAIERGGAEYVLPLDQIGPALLTLAGLSNAAISGERPK